MLWVVWDSESVEIVEATEEYMEKAKEEGKKAVPLQSVLPMGYGVLKAFPVDEELVEKLQRDLKLLDEILEGEPLRLAKEGDIDGSVEEAIKKILTAHVDEETKTRLLFLFSKAFGEMAGILELLNAVTQGRERAVDEEEKSRYRLGVM